MWRSRWLAAVFIGLTLSLLAGCASPPTSDRVARTTSAPRTDLVRVAAQQVGAPYRYGGSNRRGFDCSGLVQFVHGQIGIAVPRTTAQQWAHARTPRRRHLIPGDLVFFAPDGDRIRHVGIYEGGGMFIHAPSSGKRVGRASLDNPYWRSRMIGARTFL